MQGAPIGPYKAFSTPLGSLFRVCKHREAVATVKRGIESHQTATPTAVVDFVVRGRVVDPDSLPSCVFE